MCRVSDFFTITPVIFIYVDIYYQSILIFILCFTVINIVHLLFILIMHLVKYILKQNECIHFFFFFFINLLLKL